MIIKNKIMAIYGLPGSGKTFMANFLASDYDIIYSNVDFFRYGKKKNHSIKDVSDLHRIKFCEKKGIAIIDEGGVNISSRRSMSNENRIYTELGMLGRKKNIDILLISQLERSLDVVMRELCSYSFTMTSYFTKHGKFLFEAEIKGRYDYLLGKKTFDLVEWSQRLGWTFDTKDESRVGGVKKPKNDEVVIEKNVNVSSAF